MGVIALLAAGATAAGLLAAGGSSSPRPRHAVASDGLRHTSVEVSPGRCGRGWAHAEPGTQVFDLRNTSTGPAEVYLTDARTGAVYAELEGLAPGTARPMRVMLAGGTYAFKCVPDDADAVTGPAVRVTGPKGESGPAALPVTEHDLILPAIAYQKWVGARMAELARKTDVLKADVDRGDLAAARTDWLPAHLVYERMGAAYGTFGDADTAINGTTAGLRGGVRNPGFTGSHRLEYGLWHGQSADRLRGVADRLSRDVHTLRDGWSQQRMDPADLGLRAHEILENTVQFELTGRTDYGSGTNLTTARANIDGTRKLLDLLRPLLKTRDTALPELDAWMDRTQRTVGGFRHGDRWTPLHAIGRTRREKLNSDMGGLVERLADVAALCDVRRTA